MESMDSGYHVSRELALFVVFFLPNMPFWNVQQIYVGFVFHLVYLTRRVTQPPGGASSDIFGTDSSSDAGSEAGEAEPPRKPYR